MDAPFDRAKADRCFGVEFNNAAWDLIEAPSRTPEDADRLVHLAHAAYLHWLTVGKGVHEQRGLCLLTNAYLAVGDGAAAKKYASACLQLSQQNDPDETVFDRATAYECFARAHAALGESETARQYKQKAFEEASRIEDSGERKVFDDMVSRGSWFGIQ